MSAAPKQQAQQVMVGVLGIVFVLLLIRSLGHKNPRAAALPPPRAASSQESLLPGLVKKHYDQIDDGVLETSSAAKPAPAGYSAHSLRDPFKDYLPARPSVPHKQAASQEQASAVLPRAPEKPVTPPVLSLAGVWWAQTPGALINGRVYRPGESVQGATVKEISPEGVVMEFSGKPFLLTVSGYSGLGQAQEPNAAYGRR